MPKPSLVIENSFTLNGEKLNILFCELSWKGSQIFSSFEWGKSHIKSSTYYSQEFRVCAGNGRDKFQTNADIPSEDMNSIFFRNIRLPSKYLMAPLNSRFQPFKVAFFFLGNEYTCSYFPDFVNRVDWGLLQTISEMEKKFFPVEGFGGFLCNLPKSLCDSNKGLVCLFLLLIYRKPKA